MNYIEFANTILEGIAKERNVVMQTMLDRISRKKWEDVCESKGKLETLNMIELAIKAEHKKNEDNYNRSKATFPASTQVGNASPSSARSGVTVTHQSTPIDSENNNDSTRNRATSKK